MVNNNNNNNNNTTSHSYIPLSNLSHDPTDPIDPTDPADPSVADYPPRPPKHPTQTRLRLHLPHLRPKTLFTLLALFSLTIISLILLIPGIRHGLTRPCLPFGLSRLSDSAHKALSCSGRESMANDVKGNQGNGTGGGGSGGNGRPALESWLARQREAFLGDYEGGKGDLRGWTVVMGNEAGDLDSIASSVAYAYLSTHLDSAKGAKAIPLILTPSNLMHLRKENRVAFKMNGGMEMAALLHPDMIPSPPSPEGGTEGKADSVAKPAYPTSLSILGQLGATFALVDHNRLLPLFGNGKVVAIVDHHEDEGAHKDAETRLIQVPTGSCSSLVVKHFKEKWEAVNAEASGVGIPTEIPTLLLQALVIDTSGLRVGGKATPTDNAAADFLYPLSSLGRPSTDDLAPSTTTPSAAFSDLNNVLSEAKSDVSELNTPELLIRDYKEYELPTHSAQYPTVRAGLSTVPVGFKQWLKREKGEWSNLMSGVDGFMTDRKLDIEGVLTSFSNKDGKHRRELLISVARGGRAGLTSDDARKYLGELVKSFEGSDELVLVEWEKKGGLKRLLGGGGKEKRLELDAVERGRFAHVWKQENRKATRKQVAPLLRDAVAKFE